MNKLFDDLFGPDFCQFDDTETKHRILVPGQFPDRMYDHDEWEKNSGKVVLEGDTQGRQEDENNAKKSEDAETVRVEEDTKQGEEDESNAKKSENAETVRVEEDTKQGEEDESNAKQSDNAEILQDKFSDLKNLTRAELAAVKLPNVAFIPENEVKIIQPPSTAGGVGDPMLAAQRPSEATLQCAMKLLRASTRNSDCVDSEDEEDEVIVKLGSIGFYTKKGLQVFQDMCRISSEAAKVNQERRWLTQTTVADASMIEEVLHNSSPSNEVLRHRDIILDVSDFSSLACERYVTGFTIDVVSFKLLERIKPTGVIYLPSFSQMWAKQGVEYFRHKVYSFFSHCKVADAAYILTPLHFESPLHWGLLCFDVCTKTVYFDDGLKIHPPSDTMPIVQNMICAFSALSDGAIPQEHWNNSNLRGPLPRMNMPIQPKSGVGAGSCGVGVILTIRDIIASENCLPSFKWTFDNMANLRKELMALIIQWRSEEVSTLWVIDMLLMSCCQGAIF